VEFGYIVKNQLTKKSKGFGYITFKEIEVSHRVSEMGMIKVEDSRNIRILPYNR